MELRVEGQGEEVQPGSHISVMHSHQVVLSSTYSITLTFPSLTPRFELISVHSALIY